MTTMNNPLLRQLSTLGSTVVRPIETQMIGLPKLSSASQATFALINTDYNSFGFYAENKLESLLDFSCLRLAQSPELMLQLASLLRTPAVLEVIAGKVVRADRVQKTDVPMITINRLSTVIGDALKQVDSTIVTTPAGPHPITDIFTYLVATPIAKAGMLAPSEGTFVARTQKTFTPTWVEIKGYALAAQLRKVIETAPVGDLIRDRQVMGAILLNPLVAAFKTLAVQIVNIHGRWAAFDALGYLAAIFTLGLDQDYPEYKGLNEHPEVVTFMNNFTLVSLATQRFMDDVGSRNVLATSTLSAGTLSSQVDGLTSIMTSVREVQVVPLADFISKTSVAWLGTTHRELAGVVVAPRFSTSKHGVDVSYIQHHKSQGELGVTMLPLHDVQTLFTSATAGIAKFVETDAVEFYNIYADALLTSFESMKDNIERYVIGFRADEEYMKHLAAALAVEISYSQEGTITYVFSPAIQDYGYLLSSDTVHHATQDPALVIAFASTQEGQNEVHTINRASAAWTIGPQQIPDELRMLTFRGYIEEEGVSANPFFPDVKNTLDQRDKYTVSFGKDTESVELSFYELAMNQQSFFGSKERNVVFAHAQPMAYTAVEEFLTMLISMYEVVDAGSRSAIEIALASYFKEFLLNGTVQAFISALRAKLAHKASTPAERRARHAMLRQPTVVVSLNRDVIIALLTRTSFMSRETAALFAKSKLANSSGFLQAMRAYLPTQQ